tara:strand:- start:66 stop:338 length:273 start_codon:yes stop_codon:yes gene_type:complete
MPSLPEHNCVKGPFNFDDVNVGDNWSMTFDEDWEGWWKPGEWGIKQYKVHSKTHNKIIIAERFITYIHYKEIGDIEHKEYSKALFNEWFK